MIALYGNARSGNTRKVRWALEELGEAYEFHVLDLFKGEQRRTDYVALNPNGKVPTVVDDGFVLWESDAILWYLAETRGRGVLAPEGARERALVQQWMCWNAYHLSEGTYRARALRMTALRTSTPLDQQRHREIVTGAAPTIAILDGHLSGREHIAGERLTIADLALGMNVAFGLEEGVALAPFDNVRRWFDKLASRPAYQKANPSQ
jgi:glutathione S-transferase